MSTQPQTLSDALPSLGVDSGSSATVRLSNEIVTLLSSQLYQSPLKAIEELVVNAYDAGAGECRVFVPNPGDEPRLVLVYDNGTGMDAEGLADLWMIARSNKRNPDYVPPAGRKQIGKFGIGKLATYAIANRVTYVSRTADEILAVSTDFLAFQTDSNGFVPMKLPVTRIDPWNSLREFEILRSACHAAGIDFDSLFDGDDKSWTLVLLEELKPQPLHIGRLKWVLSTAMPLRPEFRLFLNQAEIYSSKETADVVVEFRVKELPAGRLKSIESKTGEEWVASGDGLKSDSFPEGIYGTVVVTRASLHAGKSADIGRSHGFYVRVRERLINAEDPLFGLSPLSYQTFNRFRADVVIDDLDQGLTAPREGIEESPLKEKISPLLNELFLEARERYEKVLATEDKKNDNKKEYERTYVPTRLLEHSIADVLSILSEGVKEGSEGDESWFYLDVSEQQNDGSLVASLYSPHRERQYEFSYTNKGRSARLVEFNLEQATFYLNADHDLVLGYYEDPRARALLEDLATAEAMLEVYLREHGVPPHVVGQILEKRDSLLRGLANERMFSLAAVSQLLRDSASNDHDLEVALVAAARALGFVTTHISGPGEPDGIGRYKNYPIGEYKITLEAKSSQDTPSLAQLDFAGLAEHVGKCGAHGCLLLAPKYPGKTSGEGSAASTRARNANISCWTIDQLARVVSSVETHHLGAKQVLDVVLKKFAPSDVSAAVDEMLGELNVDHRSLYAAVLQALRSLENRLTDRQRTISHVAAEVSSQPGLNDVLEGQIDDALTKLAGASQGGLLIREGRIVLTTSLEELERRLSGVTRDSGEPRRSGTFRTMQSSQ